MRPDRVGRGEGQSARIDLERGWREDAPVHDVLCQAIKARAMVRFRYRSRWRTAEPHIVGYDHEGAALLSAWQLGGGSGTGFRSFRLDMLTEIAIVPQTFEGPRKGYNPRDPHLARVLCRL